jgi:hypothetical protein
MKSRRDESKAMSKKKSGRAYGADKGMKYHDVPCTMKVKGKCK